ncbi:MAG: mannosyltransferase family protein, partial [Candidatus Paceibacterota bacterium]
MSFLKSWNIKYVFIIWIVWITILILVGAIMFGRIPVNGPMHSYYGIGEQLSVWTNWDGNNYIVIAREGYNIQSLYAFFPLLPILINLVVKILDISYPLAGVIVS